VTALLSDNKHNTHHLIS